MSFNSSKVELIETLSESKPIGKHGDDQVNNLERPVIGRQTPIVFVMQPALSHNEIADAISDINQRLNQRSQDISEEKVPKLDFTEWSHKNMK